MNEETKTVITIGVVAGGIMLLDDALRARGSSVMDVVRTVNKQLQQPVTCPDRETAANWLIDPLATSAQKEAGLEFINSTYRPNPNRRRAARRTGRRGVNPFRERVLALPPAPAAQPEMAIGTGASIKKKKTKRKGLKGRKSTRTNKVLSIYDKELKAGSSKVAAIDKAADWLNSEADIGKNLALRRVRSRVKKHRD